MFISLFSLIGVLEVTQIVVSNWFLHAGRGSIQRHMLHGPVEHPTPMEWQWEMAPSWLEVGEIYDIGLFEPTLRQHAKWITPLYGYLKCNIVSLLIKREEEKVLVCACRINLKTSQWLKLFDSNQVSQFLRAVSLNLDWNCRSNRESVVRLVLVSKWIEYVIDTKWPDHIGGRIVYPTSLVFFLFPSTKQCCFVSL